MSDPHYASSQDDDLPRTVKREKEARARDQLAREILNNPRQSYGQQTHASGQSYSANLSHDLDTPNSNYRDLPPALGPGEHPEVSVAQFNVPFVRLVAFFLKAVLAAIPALILLALILWSMGQIAQKYLPWLVKMRILISFPN
ncbi:MAG: hypothetical protein HOO99_09660 [Hyphomicrobiaceae bacterium]|nr:hypothetical protein [Hyphomicrobiaceae bacterium]